MIGQLEQRGLTYRAPDGVYFDTSRDPGYGALSRLKASAAWLLFDGELGQRLGLDLAPAPFPAERRRAGGVARGTPQRRAPRP